MRVSTLFALSLIAASAPALAELHGRDFNGSLATAEAYYDSVLNITWLADANYAKTSGFDADGLVDYGVLLSWAADAAIGGSEDWRLPMMHAPSDGVAYDYSAFSYDGVSSDVGWNHKSPSNELAYMFYVNLGNQGSHDGTGTPTPCWPNLCLVNTGPFINLMPYWYTTETLDNPFTVPMFGMHDGQLNGNQPHIPGYYGWLVHDGDIGVPTAPVPEPATWAMMLSGLAVLGATARRR